MEFSIAQNQGNLGGKGKSIYIKDGKREKEKK